MNNQVYELCRTGLGFVALITAMMILAEAVCAVAWKIADITFNFAIKGRDETAERLAIGLGLRTRWVSQRIAKLWFWLSLSICASLLFIICTSVGIEWLMGGQ